MGMMNEDVPSATTPLTEGPKGPNPENFVPVFDWNSKVVWVWVKKAGGKVVGPVEIPHKQVKKYKGKLGWLAQATEYVGMIDPAAYSNHLDIYPATWKVGDSLAPDQDINDAITAKFKPFTTSKAKAKAKKKAPEKLPKGFTLTGKKDPNGYPTAEDKETDEEFSVLPDGKIGQWFPKEGVYYIAKKLPGEEWEIHLDSTIYKPHELEPKSKPVDSPKPSEFQAATKKPKAAVKKAVPNVKPKEKKVVSKSPEKAPHLTKYIGQVDSNGFPLVDEKPEGDFEEEEAAKGLTLLPDDRVARWRQKQGYYLLYDYDPHYGFMFSKSGETLTLDETKQLMTALHLTVRKGQYHKYQIAGAEEDQASTYSAPLPRGCESIPDKDQNGLPMARSLPVDPDDDHYKLTLFPNGRLGRWNPLSDKYLYWEWKDFLGDYNYFPSQPAEYIGLKEVLKMQVQVPSAPVATPKPVKPEPKPTKKPASPSALAGTLKPTGKEDPKGYDTGSYKGSTYSMLPDRKVGVWSASNGAYILHKYDSVGDSFYNTMTMWTPPGTHKSLAYASIGDTHYAQVGDSEGTNVIVLPNGKFAQHVLGGQYLIYKVDPTQGKKFVPTGETISDDDVEAMVDVAYKSLGQTGEVDSNGLPIYKTEQSFTPRLSMLPNGDMGKWMKAHGYYRKYEYDEVADYNEGEGWDVSDPKETFTISDIQAMYLKAGLEPAKPGDEEPEPEPEPEPTAEPAFVTPKGALPDPRTLTDVGAEGLKGTTPGRTILQDQETGQRYLFKPAVQKSGVRESQLYKARSQEGFAAMAAIARPDAHVPVETVKHKGQIGTLQPMMDVDPKQPDLNGVNPSDLTDQQKVDIGSEHLIDWLMSQHDSFASNFVLTKEGRVVGIDKEQGWRYVNDSEQPDRLATDYKPNTEIYGEQEPYYNKFWKAFADGEMDFDPTHMTDALSKLEEAAPTILERVLEDYAATVTSMKGPAKTYERYAFVKQMLSRRATLRADFEKFITQQYEKREGKPGKFTFDHGWVPEGAKAKPKYQTVTHTARDKALKEFGPRALKPHKDFSELVLVRVGADEPVTKVQEFLSRMGVEPVTTDPEGNPIPMNPIMGSHYNSVIVRAADLNSKTFTEKVKIKQEVGQKFADYKGAPTYQSAALAPQAAPGDVKALAKAHKMKLGPLGKNFTLDADAVEQQTASVQRVITDAGETYYTAHFKLREPYWRPIVTNGKSGYYTWPLGAYDAKKDALVVSSYQSGAHSEAARVFSFPKGDEMAILVNDERWSFMGSVYVTIHGKAANVLTKLKGMLKKIGLDAKIMKDPTSEDTKVYNMTQALWSLAPKKHAKLDPSDLDATMLRKKLKGVLTKDQIASIRQVQGTVGRGSPIVPGLWKTLGGGVPDKPVVRFLFWTVSRDSPAKIYQTAAIGTHERLRAGLGAGVGTSEPKDMRTGGADATTVRIATVGSSGVGVSGIGSVSREIKMIIAPEILDRLDINISPGDSYGCTNPHYGGSESGYYNGRNGLSADVKAFDTGNDHTGSTEVCIRRGVPPNMIKRICADNESDRKKVLDHCRVAGVKEWNGCPIEDFVVVENNQGTIYNKYLKPLGY